MNPDDMHRLMELLQGGPVAVLSGAGLSVASGLPSYRGQNGEWLHSRPIQHQEFLSSEAVQQRYWARGFPWAGKRLARPGRMPDISPWPHLSKPAASQRSSPECRLGLHHKAGTKAVIELHGSIARVSCLGCHEPYPRAVVQTWLRSLNPLAPAPAHPRAIKRTGWRRPCRRSHPPEVFVVPPAPPAAASSSPMWSFTATASRRQRRRQRCMRWSKRRIAGGRLTDGLFRLPLRQHAHRLGKPVAAINRGVTRADPLLNLKIDADCRGGA
ncbi:MAG: Sir2 family NAD-dependent protein deacetylase [Rhodocyclaceae bacterium]